MKSPSRHRVRTFALAILLLLPAALGAQVRARGLGIPFDGTPGPLNAITDVTGIEVGQVTLVEGSGPLVEGTGPVRTGVTALLPRGKASIDPVFAAWFALNGNGEMTGTTWVDESGTLAGPILITNTHSVGVVRDAAVDWMVQHDPSALWVLPVVAETWDGLLNDINGHHVTAADAMQALQSATGGLPAEGAVGGGTGMICNGFKGGIGTSSRQVPAAAGGYTVGVLVQCNYGTQDGLLVAGVPAGRELAKEGIRGICYAGTTAPTRTWLKKMPHCESKHGDIGKAAEERGSIIIIVATDAPLLPHQLERIVRRAALGIARDGSVASNGSGDIFIAFATGNHGLGADSGTVPLQMLPNDRMNPLFQATVQATEEAVINAMIAAETMTGADDVRVQRIPHEQLREILKRYNRLD